MKCFKTNSDGKYSWVDSYQGRFTNLCCGDECDGHATSKDALVAYAKRLIGLRRRLDMYRDCDVCNSPNVVALYDLPTSPRRVRLYLCDDCNKNPLKHSVVNAVTTREEVFQ